MFEFSGDAVAGAGVEDGTAQALLTDREFSNAFFEIVPNFSSKKMHHNVV